MHFIRKPLAQPRFVQAMATEPTFFVADANTTACPGQISNKALASPWPQLARARLKKDSAAMAN